MTDPSHFMALALEEARLAAREEEIPVGALVVRDGEILGRGRNSNRRDSNPTRHAEIAAIEEAARRLSNERLIDCDLYVTKEPCAMCAGAIIHSRIGNVYIGARDARYGACGTAISVCGNPLMNHRPKIIFGVMEEECSLLLKDFFRRKRNGVSGN
jgi:tRNA(adenine34) deaminase